MTAERRLPWTPFVDETSKRNFDGLVEVVRSRRATVFIGAGVSAQARLPGWGSLLQGMYEAASLDAPQFRAATVVEDFERVREHLGDAAYLESLRSLLNPVGLTLPDIYRVLSEIPFGQYVTTNFDELFYFMVTALRHDPIDKIWVYPAGGSIRDKDYFYLHGRLISAKAGSDLVLCASDYQQAYNAGPSPVRMALNDLLEGPLVFVGSSMTDPEVSNLIRQLQQFRIASISVGGLRSDRYRSAPEWFAILAANPAALVPATMVDRVRPDDIPSLVREQAENLHPVRPIWYEYSKEIRHRRLGEIVGNLRDMTRAPTDRATTFLILAEELEALAQVNDPSRAQVSRVKELLTAAPNRRHFFGYATAGWLTSLVGGGLLVGIEEPQRGDDDNYYVTAWDAGEYLVRVAPMNPRLALQIIETTDTDNWSAISDLARALAGLPAEMVRDALPAVDRWLNKRFVASSLATLTLIELFERLLREQQWDIALTLFGLLVRLKKSGAP